MSIHLTINNEKRSNPRSATPKKPFLFGDSSWGYDMYCGWKQGLGWGEKGSVKQTALSTKQTLDFNSHKNFGNIAWEHFLVQSLKSIILLNWCILQLVQVIYYDAYLRCATKSSSYFSLQPPPCSKIWLIYIKNLTKMIEIRRTS